MIAILVFSLSLPFSGRAADGVSLTKVDWRPMRDCLGGLLSQDDSQAFDRDQRARGSLFVLDQRPSSISCPSPRRKDLAWIHETGRDQAELTVLFQNSSGGLTAKRYQFSPSKLAPNTLLQIPGSEAECTFPSSSFTSKNELTLQLNSWNLKKTPTVGYRAKQTRRYQISNVAPPKEAPRTQLQEIGLPPNGQLMKELLTEFSKSAESLQDRFSDITDQNELKNRALQCEAAARSAKDSLPQPAELDLFTSAMDAEGAAADLNSIFIQARPGRLTIKNLGERTFHPEKYSAEVQGAQ